MSFKTYQRLEISWPWVNASEMPLLFDTSMRTVFSFRESALDSHFPVSEKTNQNKTRQSIPSFNVSNTYQ